MAFARVRESLRRLSRWRRAWPAEVQLTACCLLLLLPGAPAAAGNDGDLAPGTRVRLQVDGRTVIGGVHSTTPDTLRLTLWAPPVRSTLSWSQVERLQVSRGRESRWRSAVRWGGWSALVFTAFTLPVSDRPEGVGVGEAIAANLTGGFMMGCIYGAFAPGERWENFRLAAGMGERRPEPRLGPSPPRVSR